MDKQIDTGDSDIRVDLSVTERHAADWDALVEATPHTSPFHSRLFVEAASTSIGARVAFCGLYEAGALQAGALLPAKRFGLGWRAIVSPLTPFSAFLTRDPSSGSTTPSGARLNDPLIQAVSKHFSLAHVHLGPEVTDVRPFEWGGWQVRPLYTYRVNLDRSVDPWQGWSEGTRRTFLKNRARYRVEEVVESDGQIVALCLGAYQRHGRRPPLNSARMAAFIASVRQSGLARTFVAVDTETGILSAGLAVLSDSSSSYYWVAGSQPGPAMTALVGETLARLARDGKRVFDFMGANTPGVAEFKRRFGADLVPYFRTEWSKGFLARVYNSIR